jgi:fumarate reductase flavoprotein subunit
MIGIGATSVFKGAGVAEAIVNAPKKWDQEFDVVILGAGGAGLSAAIEARDRGAKTVVLEKTVTIGGSTIISGGALAFAGTDLQDQKNVKDSNELRYKDLMTVGENMNDPVLVQAYIDNQMETYTWLKKIGVLFTSLTIASGMSVPRGHQVTPSDALKVLNDTAKAKSAQINMETSGKKLAIDEKTGRIRGVIAERKGKGSLSEKRSMSFIFRKSLK